MGALRIVASVVPFSFTPTAWTAMSISLVMRAFGALALSQRRKSLRTAFNAARSDLTLALAKSIFLALAGRVRGEVASGAPLSWTMADPLSSVEAGGEAAGTIGYQSEGQEHGGQHGHRSAA